MEPTQGSQSGLVQASTLQQSRVARPPLAPGERRVWKEGRTTFIEKGLYPALDIDIGDGRIIHIPRHETQMDPEKVRNRIAEIERRYGRRVLTKVNIFWLIQKDEEYTKPGGAHLQLSPKEYADRILNPVLEPESIKGDELVVSDDGRSVKWRGELFTFSATQAAVIVKLYEARLKGTPEVSHSTLLENAESECSRLRDLFKSGEGQRAWGTLIQTYPKARKGSARLAP